MNPCPVCSLVPCLISQGLGVQTRLARIDIDPKTSSLVLEITLL
jgi:hypothetical protein